MSENTSAQPVINVTPLIDVLLVLLIIFMIVSPIKPSAFKAKVPQESRHTGTPSSLTLIVTVNPDTTLKINSEKDFGTISEPQKMVARLAETFRERAENHAYADGMETRRDLSDFERAEKMVFIKAPRALAYGEVAKVVDAVKFAGASPISLQIDGLE